jgi:hypothetical protein
MLIQTMAAAVSIALLAATSTVPANAEPVQREHTVTSVPVEGQFICGDLVLTADGGTETEIFDAILRNGVLRIRIRRDAHDVTLAGSDGYRYTATSHVRARFLLVSPDFENPVWGYEFIIVRFRGGPHRSPLHLREELVIRNGTETDVVSGPCDFAE